MAENDIVFEDLHGVNEDQPVTVDLDADTKAAGIERAPTDQVVDDDAGNDDSVEFEGLRGAEDAPPQPLGDDTASSASVDDDYSKKVKARIQRATRATKKERDRGDYWEAQAKGLAKDSYERDKTTAERTIEQADSLIETTLTQLDAAIEAGSTKDQVRLTSLLTDQKAEKIQAEFSLNNLSPDGNVQPFSDTVPPASDDEPTKAADWMESRGDWYGARGFERQTRLANRLDKEVFRDGFEPSTDEYFEELDKRIKAKEPDLYDADVSTDDPPADRKQKRSPVAGVDGADNRRLRNSGSKVELDEDDFANMRRFNLDPNDPSVLKEYARNKREADQGERS